MVSGNAKRREGIEVKGNNTDYPNPTEAIRQAVTILLDLIMGAAIVLGPVLAKCLCDPR